MNPLHAEREAASRRANLHTAWRLATVPALFFAGTLAAPLSGAPEAAIVVLGLGALLFVAQSIAGHCLHRD